MIDTVRVNNTRYSWTSSSWSTFGVPTLGIVAWDFEETRERDIVYSNRQDGTPVGMTSGKYAVKGCKVKFLKEYGYRWRQQLAIAGAGSYGDAEFPFGAQLVEPVLGAIPITLVAWPCTVGARRASLEEGITAAVEEYDLTVLQLIEGGIPLWSIVRSLQL